MFNDKQSAIANYSICFCDGRSARLATCFVITINSFDFMAPFVFDSISLKAHLAITFGVSFKVNGMFCIGVFNNIWHVPPPPWSRKLPLRPRNEPSRITHTQQTLLCGLALFCTGRVRLLNPSSVFLEIRF